MTANSDTNKKLYLHNTKYTKTSLFMLPCLNLSTNILSRFGFVNAYLGDNDYKRSEVIPPSLFLLFNLNSLKVDFEELAEYMRGLSLYVDEYDPVEGKVIFVIAIPKYMIESLEHFKAGKYSKIDRQYVKRKFVKRIPVGMDVYGSTMWRPSVNWMILNASEKIKRQIESDLDVVLEPSTEVYSRPLLEDEIYSK